MPPRFAKRTGNRTSRAPYTHPGVYAHVEGQLEPHANNHVRREVPTIRALDPAADGIGLAGAPQQHLAEDGFVLLKILTVSLPNADDSEALHKVIQVVQSRATGEIFMNKILWWSRRRSSGEMSLPLELRVSTLRPKAVGDDGDAVGGARRRAGLLPEVKYINRMRFWQRLRPGPAITNRHRWYSMFFE